MADINSVFPSFKELVVHSDDSGNVVFTQGQSTIRFPQELGENVISALVEAMNGDR